MRKVKKPLVSFDPNYYVYPNTVGSSLLFRALLDGQGPFGDAWSRMRSDFELRSISTLHRVVHESFFSQADVQVLLKLSGEHGVFAEKFFLQSVRARVVLLPLPENLRDISVVENLAQEAYGYRRKLYRLADVIYLISDVILEILFSNFELVSDIRARVSRWFEDRSERKMCGLCGADYRVIDLPYWVYYGSNGAERCCFRCPVVEAPTKKLLFSRIPEFVNTCEFTPNSDFGPISNSFSSRVRQDNWLNVMAGIGKIGGVEHVKEKFGSWFVALSRTGALPEGVLATARGVRCLARDGHVCHSLDEQRIDNWLHENNISHEREPLYPYHPVLNSSGRRRADWKIGETYVEYFGLIGDAKYEKRMNEKLELLITMEIPFVSIYPSDLSDLGRKLRGVSIA